MTDAVIAAPTPWRDGSGVTRFSTVGTPTENRINLWEEYNESALFGLRAATMSERSLLASQINIQYGPLRLAHITGNDHVIERTSAAIKERPHDTVCLCLLLEGEAFLYHGRGCETLRAGDAVVYEVDRPFMYGFTTDMRQVIIEVPRSVLELSGRSDPYRPHVLHLAGTAASTRAQLTARRVLGAIAAGPVAQIGTQDDILDMFHLLTGSLAGAGSDAHLSLARAYIETRLSGPLSVEQVAREIGVSSRHLTRLFVEDGHTPGRYIMERRMQKAAELLSDTSWAHVSIAQVGEQVGMVQGAHFSRSFKEHFGRTPSQWRAESAERQAS